MEVGPRTALQTRLCLPLAQGSQEPGKMLPRKLKQVLQREFWQSFENLLTQGTEVGPFLLCPEPWQGTAVRPAG